jgi:hypothetical protein
VQAVGFSSRPEEEEEEEEEGNCAAADAGRPACVCSWRITLQSTVLSKAAAAAAAEAASSDLNLDSLKTFFQNGMEWIRVEKRKEEANFFYKLFFVSHTLRANLCII